MGSVLGFGFASGLGLGFGLGFGFGFGCEVQRAHGIAAAAALLHLDRAALRGTAGTKGTQGVSTGGSATETDVLVVLWCAAVRWRCAELR